MCWWGAVRHTHGASQPQSSKVFSSEQVAHQSLQPGDYLQIFRLDTLHARVAAGTNWTSVAIKDLSSNFDFLTLDSCQPWRLHPQHGPQLGPSSQAALACLPRWRLLASQEGWLALLPFPGLTLPASPLWHLLVPPREADLLQWDWHQFHFKRLWESLAALALLCSRPS